MKPSMGCSRRDLLAGAFAAPLAAALQTRRRPNFIVICTDDHGYRDLGCQGATDLKTPNIDALAASGARFTNWYSNAPVCAPSRSSLLTGRYPERAGIRANGAPLLPEQRTIASLLKPLGYATAAIGKWHLGPPPDSDALAHGFDYFYGFRDGCVDFYSHRYYWGEPRRTNFHDLWRNREEIFEDGAYLTERIASEAAQFIDANRSGPFFLYVPFNAPHYPMHAPKTYTDRFPQLDLERRVYAAMISAVDDGVEQILGAVKRVGLTQDTLVFFVSDNGATTEPRAGRDAKPATAGDNSPFRGFKFSLFDGGMHVPAIVSWPGTIPAAQTVREVAMTMDILPTIAKAAGAKTPPGYLVDGSDILSAAAAKAPSPHAAIFWQRDKQGAVRQGKWKLVMNGNEYGRTPETRGTLQGDDAVWLSDLEKDPGEAVNLRRQNPGKVDELTTLHAAWQKSLPGTKENQ